MQTISDARHRFPPDVIRQAVWLYRRLTLSYRYVEDLLAERGVEASYETVRRWVLKFGPAIAQNLRRCRPRPDDRWHLDEVVVSINGRHLYFWRAVDSDGEVLDVLVPKRRNKVAARKLRRKLLKRYSVCPRDIVTDKLRSYAAALREIGFCGRHDQSVRANNRAENSHQPLRRRERKMQCFKSAKSVQRFVALHAALYNVFSLLRHLISRNRLRHFRAKGSQTWAAARAAA